MPRAVVDGLRARGADVRTAAEAELLGAEDPAHLAQALRERRVLFTHDADFLRLHAEGSMHMGIVYASQETPIGDIVRGLMLIHDVLSSEEIEGQVEYL